MAGLVLPDFFRALSVRLIEGRDFTARDDVNGLPVAIVNRAFQRRFFANSSALGKRVRVTASSGTGRPEMREIVGIVADVRSRLTAEAQPEVYLPYGQLPITNSLTLVLRTDTDPRGAIAAARAEVHALDKELPFFGIETLDEHVSRAATSSRFNALLLTIFAAAALMLTVVGLYGVVAYVVGQRTHEIGIRMALGASGRTVVQLVLRDTLRWVALGVVMGLGGALIAARWVASLLFGLRPHDPATIGLAALLLSAVAAAAAFLPARRAARIDPLAALRHE